ncbi:hypothetical protein B9Z36_09205 [Limnohabitans sp. Rim8]|nr:hypothetical protein B9Z36_09205 [Limnohabitans sp. Rim8]
MLIMKIAEAGIALLQTIPRSRLHRCSAFAVSVHSQVNAMTETIGSASKMAARVVLRLLASFTNTMTSAETSILIASFMALLHVQWMPFWR